MPSEMTTRDLHSTGMTLRAATINEADRSVEAVLTTGNVVPVLDWSRWEIIDEILLTGGALWDEQVPLLESHSRYSTEDVLGSIRSIRREAEAIVGRLTYVEGDEAADKVWNKVRQGHLRDVSIGYQVLEATEIPPNTKGIVQGREYAAGPRTLRVATSYRIKEGSNVVIGADQAAKIRAEHTQPPTKEPTMPNAVQPGAAPPNEPITTPVTEGTRAEATSATTPPATAPAAAPTIETRAAPASPQIDHMARMKGIRNIAKLNSRAINDELVEACLDDPNCTVEMATEKFLAAHRGERAAPVGAQAGGGVNVKDDEKSHALRELAFAMCQRQGVDPSLVVDQLRGTCYTAEGKQASPLAGRSKDELASLKQRAAALSSWSQDKLIERALSICNVAIPDNRLDMLQRALSSSAVQDVFTTNVQASLLIGYMEAPDSTTAGFVSETDVDNYLDAEAVDLGKMGGMKLRQRGKPADHGDLASLKETFSVKSFSEQFGVDEMDLINDRFGAIQARGPLELGADAARLRPDLVYSMILANPTLSQDSTAVFHADHNNLLTTATYAMSKAALEYGLKAMASQYTAKGKNKIRLNLRGKYVIVPTGLGHFTRELIGSSVVLISGATDRTIGNMNALANDNLVVIEEARIDATGCFNPLTEAMVTGSATNWFLASDQRKSLQVAYLRGTGRVPRLRTNRYDRDGLYGLQWDVEHSIGTKFLGFRDWLKANGA